MLSLANFFLFIALVCWVGGILGVIRLKLLAWQKSEGDVKKYLYRNTSWYVFSSTDSDDPEIRELKRRIKLCTVGMVMSVALAWFAG